MHPVATTLFVMALGACAAAAAAFFLVPRWVLGPKAKRTPKPGEKWRMRNWRRDPWEPHEYPPVTILDVRDGWVRYDLLDSREKVSTFVRMYTPID